MQLVAASIIKLCDTTLMEDQYLLDEMRLLEDPPHENHTDTLPSDCNIIIASDSACSEVIYLIGLMFLDNLREWTETKRFVNARYKVGKIFLRIIIPSTEYYILGRLRQVDVLEKFMFNSLRLMMRSTKLAYCEFSKKSVIKMLFILS